MKYKNTQLTSGADVLSIADLWYSIIMIFIACLFSSRSRAVHWAHGVADI